jgi:hypothetical protein
MEIMLKVKLWRSQNMMGEEAEEMRSRAKKLGETARKAVEVGGSSCSDFNALIE